MVKCLYWAALLCIWLLGGEAMGAHIEVDVHGERATAYGSIEGYVRVQRREVELLDPSSFRLQNRALEVEFLHESLHSTVSIVGGRRREERSICSTYRFSLPGVAPGEYVLPPVSVVVGGVRVQAETVPYFIHSGSSSEDFRLRAFVRGPKIVYPGQSIELVYRLAYRQQVEPTYQNLPFLEPKGFRKIGEPVRSYSAQEEVTIEETLQKVQALAPGTYPFAAAVLEGVTFHRDFFGRRIYDKQRLRAESQPFDIVIAPFPESGRPVDFDGALGTFTLEAQLLGTDTVMVGDRLRLEVQVNGAGVWSTVRAPNLSRLNVITRHFRLSDLPPEVHESPSGKRFLYELRPLSDTITEIPSIGFSSFDPNTHHYHTARTEAIPLTVTIVAPGVDVSSSSQSLSEQVMPSSSLAKERLMEIRGVFPVSIRDVKRQHPPWKGLWVFPLIGLVWVVQWWLHRYLVPPATAARALQSAELLKQARQGWSVDLSRALRDLEAALLLKLYEAGHVADIPVIEDLLPEGIMGSVRIFLESVHQAQYGSQGMVTEKELQYGEQLWADLS